MPQWYWNNSKTQAHEVNHVHGPCLEAGRIQAKKDRREIARGKRKNKSDTEWIVVEKDVFPFSSTVYRHNLFPRGHIALLNFHSLWTLCFPGRKSMPFPMKRTHAADESIRSYSNKSLKPMNLLWKCTDFFFKLQLVCIIRSMILEWHIEYFIDCLHALRWPAWHANFSSQKRLCVTLYQAARHDAPRTFPVNKLLRSRGEHRAEVSRAHTHSTHQPPSPDSPSIPLRMAL